ncbi:MAG: PhnD/SsuA/transferrin family substrate-binding protein [Anaerolineales bacterium]|nr:PhnD/SsuA/transferrin family substrate-binding protein [Anaerolineales bacterium]
MKRHSNLPHRLFAALALAALMLGACTPAATSTPTSAPAPTEAVATEAPPTEAPTTAPTDVPPTDVPTDVPEPTATTVALGSPDKPIIMAIAPSATSDTLIASGNTIAELLSAETGLTIQAVVPTNYQAMIQAMCSGNGQIGWLPPFAYLVAQQTMTKDAAGNDVPCADVAFITLRNGLDHYATQFIGASGVFTPGTTLEALKQFADKKPCWTDPLSASGYVIPASLLAQEGVKTKTAAFVQGHPTVVRAVYAGGICDFGATFVDARTNSAIQTDLPDVNDKVVVVYQTENIIPNDTVAFAFDVPEDLRATLAAAFEKVSKSEEGAAAMKTLYSIDGLQSVDDTFFDDFRVLLAASGIDIATLVK